MKNKTRRRQEAESRQAEYDQLTLEEKLGRALERGHEGTREVARLQAKIDKATVADPT